MSWLITAFAVAASSPPQPQAERAAVRGTVRIERASPINSDAFSKAAPGRRRERLVRGATGKPYLLRLIEFE